MGALEQHLATTTLPVGGEVAYATAGTGPLLF
jgi:hypothetical protein